MSRCGAGVIRCADESRADQPRQAEPENRQRKPGRHLVDGEPEREHGENCRHRHARQDAADGADQGRSGELGAAKAADRAHDHHAFDAEIEHAGALDHEFA